MSCTWQLYDLHYYSSSKNSKVILSIAEVKGQMVSLVEVVSVVGNGKYLQMYFDIIIIISLLLIGEQARHNQGCTNSKISRYIYKYVESLCQGMRGFVA